jgi:hypothetical protein
MRVIAQKQFHILAKFSQKNIDSNTSKKNFETHNKSKPLLLKSFKGECMNYWTKNGK